MSKEELRNAFGEIIFEEGNIITSYGQLGAGMTNIMLLLAEKEYRSRKNETLSNL